MCKIDPTIDWSFDQFGFSSVIVTLDDRAAMASPLGLADSVADSARRASYYLKELPTQIGATASNRREQIARAFDPDSPQGVTALAVARSIGGADAKGDRSKRQRMPIGVRAPGPKAFPMLGLECGYVDRDGLSRLSRDDQVTEIASASALSAIFPVEIRSGRPGKSRWTWGLNRMGIPDLRAEGLTGKGVKVGHLDTGIDVSHHAFRGTQVTFQEFDHEGEAIGKKPRDSGRHGTHTAGTICGGEVGQSSKMNIGVAPGVELFSGLVISGGSPVRILAGIEWCLQNQVQVMNMSFGYPGYNPFFKKVIQRIIQLGVIPVVAIGNDGVGTSCSPGNYEEVLSVGAMDRKDEVPGFSSSIVFNRSIDPYEPNIVAPGVGVLSAKPNGGLLSMDGTSMAAPHVSGCVALLLEDKPNTPPNKLIQAIQLTSEEMRKVLKKYPASRRGYGLINPKEALKLL